VAAHVFLSYAAEDREAARRLAEALIAQGHTVWWDRLIAGGALWSEAIERALADAWVVVVLWSEASTRSDFVRAEARHAADRGILVPARLETCEPPMPFGEYQTIDLTEWKDGAWSEIPEELIDALRRVREGEGTPHVDEGASSGRQPRANALLVYLTNLFEFAAAPQTFLLARWDTPERMTKAATFYAFSAALELVIGLPLVQKVGGSIGWEIFTTTLYAPLRVVVLGAIVQAAFRSVGGRAGAVGTLTAFAYVHSVQMLLFECTQGFVVGLLEAIAPAVVDRLAGAVVAGDASDVTIRILEEQGFAASAAVVVLIAWPLIVVPFACWGAFRARHEVSKMRSATAAALALILGMLAYAMTVVLSFADVVPG
jgi:hypothetical protein